jgi:hypothetical protein
VDETEQSMSEREREKEKERVTLFERPHSLVDFALELSYVALGAGGELELS